MNYDTARHLTMPEVFMAGRVFIVEKCRNVPSLHRTSVVKMPGNFRDMVKTACADQLGMVPDGVARTIMLDQLEEQAVVHYLRIANAEHEPRRGAP